VAREDYHLPVIKLKKPPRMPVRGGFFLGLLFDQSINYFDHFQQERHSGHANHHDFISTHSHHLLSLVFQQAQAPRIVSLSAAEFSAAVLL